jgi:DNA-binding GntR family transcriptional regulator
MPKRSAQDRSSARSEMGAPDASYGERRGIDRDAGDVPLYLQVARALQCQIHDGVYPIGSLLPTEIELGALFGVSRQTVRQAAQLLRQQKILSARKGVGTRVEARQPERAYYYALQSLVNIFQFASEATLVVLGEEMIPVSGALATKLGSRPEREWLHLVGMREVTGRAEPICWTEVYVHSRYARIIRGKKEHRSAIFSAIEEQSGEPVTEVEQEIVAVTLSREIAEAISAQENEPALQITRRYFGPGRRLFEMSINVHPADRFSYLMTLKREMASGKSG